MIITRTPLRISFFGGGTDYPAWYKQNGGAVLSTTIDKYIYLNCRYLPPFFENKHRVVWSKIELVNDRNRIKHPVIREVLRFLDVDDGMEIHSSSDLPAWSGMGSSSSFTVGLLHAMNVLLREETNKRQLALDAIHVEQELLRENVGSQDQVAVAVGGFNKIIFGGNEEFEIIPVKLSEQRIDDLQDKLMLFFTGLSRRASDIAGKQIKMMDQNSKELMTMREMVDEGVAILSGDRDLKEFGKLLHEAWQIKRGLTDLISNRTIDEAYDTARNAGAIGGKLLGAGGGGFMLFFVEPERQEEVKRALGEFLHVPFKFEDGGSEIIYAHDGLDSSN